MLESHAEELSQNFCLMQALRNFVAQGGRIYAEGSGLAYLCERVILSDGRQFPMAGLLSGAAVAQRRSPEALPAEITFGRNNWLGERGVVMRGYLDSSWDLKPGPDLISFAAEESHRWNLVGTQRVVGCGMQVDFAGQPHLVSSFFRPRLSAFVGAH
jgi:cobyrinic acid a,c-diamide synthase